ncbi:MAG: type I-U CRISPR-associated helicase/endonuclease Cas3 [Opitutales bacterium]|nr:type I-U CRISPR-associated helicase/endonuclease Cas3 [Opitutales bacterium]
MLPNFPTFPEFFAELNDGHTPFPWQSELAERAVAGDWPDCITAPTGSGKTACLEVAVYALASQAHLPPAERNAARRIFFIVNRRVIVDEAFDRAQRMTLALADPGSDRPACAAVAEALRSLNPSPFPHPPLDCVQLRGAIFRDQRWTRSLLQPTLVATTIDQIGSRMLFRGYGVTPNARPIHAALVATDALWILDEAHISRPFAETAAALQRFREHHIAQNPPSIQPPPLRWVQMTATPPKGATNMIALTDADREHPVLSKRLNASKPVRLKDSPAKTKSKEQETLAADLMDQAATIIAETAPRSLAIMVNRVATARRVAELVAKESRSKKARFQANTSLLIGRMRPIDRDAETQRIQAALKTAARRDLIPEGEAPPPVEIVVATQCLEVGADLDFDALVTECASLDALRQRFGRLNRTGRDIPACGCIVMPGHLIETDRKKLDKLAADGQPLDPIYGNALSETWNWLQSIASGNSVDFGITHMGTLVENLRAKDEDELNRLQAPTSSAPVLFPAYLDAWAQTNPAPWPDPDPALFLHGKQTARPDVLVLWRADLPENADFDAAIQNLSLCPPSQVEALPVPLHVFQNWFFQANAKAVALADTGDVLDAAASVDAPAGRNDTKDPIGTALLWRGASESKEIKQSGDLYPGATIVLPLTLGGWSELGHIPNASPDPATLEEKDDPLSLAQLLYPEEEGRVSPDRAEEAFRITRDRALLRLRAELYPGVSGGEAWQGILAYAGDPDASLNQNELRNLLKEASQDEALSQPLRESLLSLHKLGFTEARYTDERGIVLTTRRRLRDRLRQNQVITQAEDEADEWSRATATGPVTLRAHTDHVRDLVVGTARALGLSEDIRICLAAAAELHDWGKLDPRFQALLLGGNPHAAYALSEPLAKSDRLSANYRERKLAHRRSALPKGFRHEFSSLRLATHPDAAELLPNAAALSNLTLHLIAAHHGHARPFAPVIDDSDPPTLSTHSLPGAPALSISGSDRTNNLAHRLDSGIPDRFWRLLRQHGPWGLAFLETILRLADQQASEAEAEGWYADDTANLETNAAS